MNRTEFVVAIAIILFVAFCLGWFIHWLVQRFSRVASPADMSEMDELARALHEAEEAKEQAALYFHEREAELKTELAQAQAELRAAMEGLREARTQAEELRGYIETQNQG